MMAYIPWVTLGPKQREIFTTKNTDPYLIQQLILGLGRISGQAGYPAIFNIRPGTGYQKYPVTGYPADF